MAVALADYVKASPNDAGYVTQCETEATAMVDRRIGTATVPAEVRDRAVLEVGADLFWRRSARNGIATMDGNDVAPLRINRDPMAAAAAILAPYLGPAVA